VVVIYLESLWAPDLDITAVPIFGALM